MWLSFGYLNTLKILLNYFEKPGTFLGGKALLTPADFSSWWRAEAVSSGI